jgi:hypothetical protein
MHQAATKFGTKFSLNHCSKKKKKERSVEL